MIDSPTLHTVAARLAQALDQVAIGPPAAYVYDPLVYAREPYEDYLRRYGAAPKEVVLLGMNPGPFGMAQTGVPFGEVELVRDWLGDLGPRRPSSARAPPPPGRGLRVPPQRGERAPLVGVDQGHLRGAGTLLRALLRGQLLPAALPRRRGRNVTPDRLVAADRKAVFAACDAALRRHGRRPAPSAGRGSRPLRRRARSSRPRRDPGDHSACDPSQSRESGRQPWMAATGGPGTRRGGRGAPVTPAPSGTLAVDPTYVREESS